jgi:diguanylate cyclase (GGDEF)-like protein
MPQALTIISILLILSALLGVYLAAWARLHSRVPAASDFFWLFLCVALYSAGYAVEISHSDLSSILIAIRLEYFGLAFVAPMLLLFALHFVRGCAVPPSLYAAILFIPSITLIIVLTIESHDLFYVNPRIDTTGYFPVLVFERGFWYNVQYIYLLLTSLSSVVLFIVHAFRTSRKKKHQAITMAVGSFVPLLSAVIYIAGIVPGNIDLAPFALVISGVVYWFALFRLGLFELVPAAREMALDTIRDAFLVVNKNNILLDLNPAARSLPGLSALNPGDDLEKNEYLGSHLKPLLQREVNQVHFSLNHPLQGQFFYSADSYNLQPHFFSSSGISILIRDETETTMLMKKLSNQANLDSLTGLLNRRYLMQLGEQQLALARKHTRPLGVILFDLDHFKAVNDHYGHLAGDEVLKYIARRAENCLRSDDLLGRYGGEEFVVFLLGADLSTSIAIGERIRQGIETIQVDFQGQSINISVSVGVYTAPINGNETLTEMLGQADRALYQAKHNGRNQVCSTLPQA